MTNPFTAIPPTARKYLYLAYATVGLILGGLQVYGTEQVGALDVSKCLEVLAYAGVVLGFTAASNLPSYEDVVQGDAPPPENGNISLSTIVLVLLGIAAVVFIASLVDVNVGR